MIHIQSDRDRTRPHHFDCSCAMWGAIESGLDYRLTSFEEVESGKFDAHIRTSLFVGSVEFMREVFKRIGLMDVRLPFNSDRPCEIITLEEAHKRVANGEKLFIKPVQTKLFTGLVLDGCVYSCLKNLPPDTKVMAYEPFPTKIISEWRLYVHKNKVVDARNYSGDFSKIPSIQYFNDILRIGKESPEKISFAVKDLPCAYTIDVGILGGGVYDGINVIVELNDFFAIGCYGIENSRYLKMLTDRYFEIVHTND